MFKLGLAGAGAWGRNFIRTIQSHSDLELSAVFSRNPSTRELIDPGTRIVESFDALLDCAPDGVILASPAENHYEQLLQTLDRKLPCLVEKPMVLDPDQAREVQTLAEKNGVPVVVDHIHLFSEAFRELKSKSAREEIESIESEAGNKGPFREGCSPLWDWGPHDVAMALDLVQSHPTEIQAELTPESNYRVTLEFPQCRAHLHFGSHFKSKTRNFSVTLQGGRYLELGSNQTPKTPMEVLLSEFAFHVMNPGKSKPISDVGLGVEVTRILKECENQIGGERP